MAASRGRAKALSVGHDVSIALLATVWSLDWLVSRTSEEHEACASVAAVHDRVNAIVDTWGFSLHDGLLENGTTC